MSYIFPITVYCALLYTPRCAPVDLEIRGGISLRWCREALACRQVW